MLIRIKSLLNPSSTRGLALRGTLATVGLAGGGHVLRFASNLILTRLLFPEAFGLMALVMVILTGLELVSTVGLRAAVIQNKRADEDIFLNTAWVIQIIRGLMIWVGVCLFAAPFAALYEQPELTTILPVAGLSLALKGLTTTKVLTAQRHLQLARYSALTLIAQVIQLIVIAILAYIFESVWALVAGLLIQPAVAVILYGRFLEGIQNRVAFDKSCASEIFNLGKFLILSSIATYILTQSDRIFLGLVLPIDLLGIYSVGFALAVLPLKLAQMINNQVVFPLYRIKHPLDAPENQKHIFKARRMVTGSAVILSCLLALVGPILVDFFYDERYVLAGPVASVLCIANIPKIIFNHTMHAAVVKGDSFRFMIVNLVNAIAQISLIALLVWPFGILGAAFAVFCAPLLSYPLSAIYLKRYANWDAYGDATLLLIGIIGTSLALLIYLADILALLPN